MKLGQKVTYIRHTAEGQVDKGEGFVLGIGLDPDKQAIALIQDADDSSKRVNAYVNALNYSPAFEAKFVEGIAKIDEIAKKGNALSKAIVEKYNGKVLAVKKRLFGKQVEV